MAAPTSGEAGVAEQDDPATGQPSAEEREAAYRRNWDVNLAAGRPLLHQRLQLELVQLRPHVVLTMQLSEDVEGFAAGSVHGGILATFADVAGAVSLWDSFQVEHDIPVTTDLHVRFFRQPKGGPLRAEARVVHQSPRLVSNECVITDAHDRVLARTTASYMIQPLRR